MPTHLLPQDPPCILTPYPTSLSPASQVRSSPMPSSPPEIDWLHLMLLTAGFVISTAALLLLLLHLYLSPNRVGAALALAQQATLVTGQATTGGPPAGYFILAMRAALLRLSETAATPLVAAALYIWPELEAAAAATPTGGVPGEGPLGWGVPLGGAQAGGVGGGGGWGGGGGVRGAIQRSIQGAEVPIPAPADRPIGEYRGGGEYQGGRWGRAGAPPAVAALPYHPPPPPARHGQPVGPPRQLVVQNTAGGAQPDPVGRAQPDTVGGAEPVTVAAAQPPTVAGAQPDTGGGAQPNTSGGAQPDTDGAPEAVGGVSLARGADGGG
eukprot:scaffold30350_cov105-Isochrysis_galbana.AAC.4